MFLRYTAVFTCLGLISLSGAYNITSIVEDGIPESLNITTEPFVKIGNGYYYIEYNQKGDWYQAYLACREIGAELVSFETREEMDAMTAYLPIEHRNSQYWTSGTDLAVKGQHVWFSNAEPLSDDVWYPGEPNDLGGNERCGIYRGSRTMNDAVCARVELYICEAPRPKTASFVIR